MDHSEPWRRSPPRQNNDGLLVARIVRERPGISFSALLAEGFFAHELVPTLRQLVDMREIRRDGAQFYPRTRQRKPKIEPVASSTFWSRLAGLFRRGH